MHTEGTTEQTWQVAVLDGGLAGAALASVLARNGLRVLILDSHAPVPGAGGEVVIPYTAMLLRLLGKRYRVPELAHLATVTPSTGAGRSLGFFFHQGAGGTQHPDQVHQIAAPEQMPPEPVLFRQEADAAMRKTALGYGAEAPEAGHAVDVRVTPAGVRIATDRGEAFHAEYVVDCGGRSGILWGQQELTGRPLPVDAPLHTISTHMTGVQRLDPLAGEARRAPCSWDTGTVHHVFDGGYLWCTPFGNHDEAVHQVSSVGFCLDARRLRPGADAEAEFRGLLARVPLAAEQLATAQAVQPFHHATLQDTAEHCAGERWCLLPESTTGVDGLFSWSLTCGLELVDTLAHRLLAAARTGQWPAADVAPVDRLARSQAASRDRVHRMFLDATADHSVFVAALKVLSLGTMLGTFRLAACMQQVDGDAPGALLTPHETADPPGPYFAGHRGYRDLLVRAADLCTAVRIGCVESQSAADRILDAVAESGFAPLPFGFANPEARFYHPTPDEVAAVLTWAEKAEDATVGHLVRSTLLAAISHQHG